MPEHQIKISVIICSRDRAPSLRVTLDSVFTPKNLESADWECLLVYHPSDRPTERVAGEYARKFPSRLAPIGQHGTGKSPALNDGIRAARGEILAFTDDDCLCDAAYFDGIREVFADPAVSAVQGRELVEFDAACPKWFGGELIKTMGLVDYGMDFAELTPPRNMLYGSNMLLRRRVFAQAGGFRLDLGAGTAEPGGMAEDVEFSRRVLKAGYRIFYAPQILIRHRVGADRLNRWFYVSRFYRSGLSTAHYWPQTDPSMPLWRRAIYQAKEALLALALGLRLQLVGRASEAMDALLPVVADIGFQLEHLRLRRRRIRQFPVPAVLDEEGRPLPEGAIRAFTGPGL